MKGYRERLKIIQECIENFAVDVERDLFIPQMNVHDTSKEFIPSRMVQIFEKYMRNDQIKQIDIMNAKTEHIKNDIEETKALIEHTKRDAAKVINDYVLQSAYIKSTYDSISKRVARIQNSLNGRIEKEEQRILEVKSRRQQLQQESTRAKSFIAAADSQIRDLRALIEQQKKAEVKECENLKNYIKREMQHRMFLYESRLKSELDKKERELAAQEMGIDNKIKQMETFLNDVGKIIGDGKKVDIAHTDEHVDVYVSNIIEENIAKKVEKETKIGNDRKTAAKKFKKMYDDAIRKKEAEIDKRLNEARAREKALIDKIKESTKRFSPYSIRATPTKSVMYYDDYALDETMSKIQDIQYNIRSRPPLTPK